jgi:hypothetical protein
VAFRGEHALLDCRVSVHFAVHHARSKTERHQISFGAWTAFILVVFLCIAYGVVSVPALLTADCGLVMLPFIHIAAMRAFRTDAALLEKEVPRVGRAVRIGGSRRLDPIPEPELPEATTPSEEGPETDEPARDNPVTWSFTRRWC